MVTKFLIRQFQIPQRRSEVLDQITTSTARKGHSTRSLRSISNIENIERRIEKSSVKDRCIAKRESETVRLARSYKSGNSRGCSAGTTRPFLGVVCYSVATREEVKGKRENEEGENGRQKVIRAPNRR